LSAAVVVPLFLTEEAYRTFTPYKVGPVRLLGVIVTVAIAIHIGIRRRLPTVPGGMRRSSWVTFAALIGAQVLATLFSVSPHASVWGGQDSWQGLITSLAEMMIFLGVVLYLNDWSQIDRLVNTIIATTIPIGLYALVQALGFDPLIVEGGLQRGISTLGTGIHLAAYLTMVMPLTWWRLAQEAKGSPGEGGRRGRTGGVIFYVAAAAVQVAAFLCAQSRGPVLGLLATATIAGFGWTLILHRWRWAMAMGAVLGLAVAFLCFVNLPLAASKSVANALHLGRFAGTLQLAEGGDPFRKGHWTAGVDLMTSRLPIAFPNGGKDTWSTLRPWIGFGPETLEAVLPQRYIWANTALTLEYRLHNRVLDLWFSIGALGAASFLAFFVSVWTHGIENAGLRRTSFDWVTIALAAGIGGVLFATIGGRGFAGLGLAVGLVAGCMLCLVIAAYRRGSTEPLPEKKGSPAGLLAIALMAALGGHLIETSFSFPVSATSLLFWLEAAMVLVLMRVGDNEPKPLLAATPQKARSGRPKAAKRSDVDPLHGVWLDACGPALILITILFAFLQFDPSGTSDFLTVLGRGLTKMRNSQAPSHLAWLLLIPTWLATNYIFLNRRAGPGSLRYVVQLAVSGAIGLAFAVVVAVQTTTIGGLRISADLPEAALAQIAGYQTRYFLYVGIALALVFFAAVGRGLGGNGSKSWVREATMLLVAICVALPLGWFVGLRQIRGDITAAWGRRLFSDRQWRSSTAVLARSVQEVPESLDYRRGLAWTLLQRAAAEPESAGWLLDQAETNLGPALVQDHGLNTVGLDLGRIYLQWAAVTGADERLKRAKQGEAAFDRLQHFVPGHTLAWLEDAVLDEQFLHQPLDAEQKFLKAVAAMAQRYGYWAQYCREHAAASRSPELHRGYLNLGFRVIDAGLRDNRSPAAAAMIRLEQARLHIEANQLDEALAVTAQARSAVAVENLWQTDEILARIDLRRGDRKGALDFVGKAIAGAPTSERGGLLELKRQIEAR